MSQPDPAARDTLANPSLPERPRRRWLGNLVTVTLLALFGLLAWYLTHRPPVPVGGAYAASGASGPRGAGAPGRGGPPSTVGIASAHRADIPVIIEALGTVTASASVTVTPQVSGVITQVLYREGQMVQQGQLLATLDPQPFQLALAQSEAALARDSAELEAARQLLERYQVLQKQDSIAGQTVDTQAALVQQLVGTVALDRANAGSARLNLQWSRIVAPVAGRVGLRPIDAGNFVAAGAAAGVASITRVSPIDVAFAIPQSRLPALQRRLADGAELSVSAWDSTRSDALASGRFFTLDNQIDVSTGTVKAKARFANTNGALFPNQFVNVRLLLDTVSAAVVVPVTALRHGPSGDFVYTVDAERVVSIRPVTAGLSGINDVAITQGLALGELVVTEGGDRLRDGSHVLPAGERPASAAAGASSPRGRRHAAGASGAAS